MKVKRFLAMLQSRGIIELKKHEVVKCNLIKTVITPDTTPVMIPDITTVIAKVLKKQGLNPNDVSEAVITTVITNVTKTVSNTIKDLLKNDNNPEVSGFKKTATLSNSGLNEAEKSTPQRCDPPPKTVNLCPLSRAKSLSFYNKKPKITPLTASNNSNPF